MSELIRLSLSIEKPLYDELEKLVKKSGYVNRSEFVRDMIRDRLVKTEWDKDEEVLGTSYCQILWIGRDQAAIPSMNRTPWSTCTRNCDPFSSRQ